MPSSKDKVRIKQNAAAISNILKSRAKMIEAFQHAFRALQEKLDGFIKSLNMLCDRHPEIFDELRVQSEEAGTDEDSGGDEKPRILSLSSDGVGSGDEASVPSRSGTLGTEDEASSEAPDLGHNK